MFERPKSGERAALVQVDINRTPDPAVEEEFHQLALSAGAQIIWSERYSRAKWSRAITLAGVRRKRWRRR